MNRHNESVPPLGICSGTSSIILVFSRLGLIGQCAVFFLVILTCCTQPMCGFYRKVRKIKTARKICSKQQNVSLRIKNQCFFPFLICLKQQKSKLRFMSILIISSHPSRKLRINQCAAIITPFSHIYAHVDINM